MPCTMDLAMVSLVKIQIKNILIFWIDINECHAVVNPCDLKTQKCINTDGSYLCECKSLNKKDNTCALVEKNQSCPQGFYSLNNKCLGKFK